MGEFVEDFTSQSGFSSLIGISTVFQMVAEATFHAIHGGFRKAAAMIADLSFHRLRPWRRISRIATSRESGRPLALPCRLILAFRCGGIIALIRRFFNVSYIFHLS